MTISAIYTVDFDDGTEAFVRVAPDLVLPRFVELTVTDEKHITLDLRIDVEFDEELHRYAAVRLEGARRAVGEEVNLAALQSLKIRSYLQTGLRRLAWIGQHKGPRFALGITAAEASKLTAGGPSSPDSLLAVARVYALANALNLPPAKTVQDELRLTAPTSSVWIRRAKAFSLLDIWGTEVGDHFPRTIAAFIEAHGKDRQ